MIYIVVTDYVVRYLNPVYILVYSIILEFIL